MFSETFLICTERIVVWWLYIKILFHWFTMTSLNFLFLLWHVTFKPLLHISYTSPFTQKILLQQTFEIIEIAFSVLSRFDKLNRNHYLSSKKCFFGERSYSANSFGKRKEQEQWEELCWRVIQNYLEPFIWWIDSCPCLKACVGYSRSWLEFFYYFLDIRSNQQSPGGKEGVISWYFHPYVNLQK